MAQTAAESEWGVLLKCRLAGPPASEQALDRVVGALPGTDKRRTGGGSDFTIWTWHHAPDAARAVDVAARLVRQAAADNGITAIQVIRAHAASIEGRSSPFRGVAEHVGRADEWTIYFRASAPPGAPPAPPRALEQIAAALDRPDVAVSYGGDREKFLLDDGRGVVVRFWVGGPQPGNAFREARRAALAALAAAGLGDWAIVRLQAATAEARHGDTFPGLAARRPQATEETR